MILKNYIQDLLYRYDCVIVPNFGGFVTNKIGATIEGTTMYPPTKRVSFNAQLVHNDGLLVNHVASTEKISFNEANVKVATIVTQWKTILQSQSLDMATIGTFSYNEEKQLVFEPNTSSNFNVDSFGLAPVEEVSAVERYKAEVKPLIPEVEEVVSEEENNKRNRSVFIKYAAAVAVLLTGYFGVNQYNKNTQLDALAKDQNALEQKIQKATFVIDDQLPTVNLDVTKENSDEIFIIAGAFQLEKNANKKIEELKEMGYDARVIGENAWGLTQVAVGNYTSKEDAEEALTKVREEVSKDAWILVK